MKKGNLFFSSIIAAVYVLTVVLLIASLAIEYAGGRDLCEERFNEITRKTAEAASLVEPGSPDFTVAFMKAVGTIDDIAVIQLSTPDGLLLSYPANTELAPASTSSFVRSFNTKLNSRNSTLTLTAAIYLLKPSSLFTKCAIAFLVLLAATLAVVIKLYSLRQAQGAGSPGKAQKQAEQAAPEHAMQIETESVESFARAAENLTPPEALDEEEYAVTDDAYPERADQEPGQEDAGQEAAGTDTPAGPDMTEARGLFSPATGFGWQAYMKPRLESELERAAASEIDLTLLTIRVPGLERASEADQSISSLIINFAGFKDLVFEYGADGSSVIMQGIDVDSALSKAEGLYDKITRELAANYLNLVPAIGLSARSLRLISADRLANESEQALKHALDEESGKRIIAFRVDPDKYRSILLGGGED